MKDTLKKSSFNLAVLIDAENARPADIQAIFTCIDGLGTITIKRIYGDFSNSSQTNASWKTAIMENAIKPLHSYAFSKGKNSSDSALIIDAMDLLYGDKEIDGICLVSSDSDFTTLVMRIKEQGLKCYGFGEDKTPPAFRKACDKFYLTKNLRGELKSEDTMKSIASRKENSHTNPDDYLVKTLESCPNEDGWVELGVFGRKLKSESTSFTYQKYGSKKLADLVKKKQDIFITKDIPTSVKRNRNFYVKLQPDRKINVSA
jgi:hypothetical protein